MSFIGGHWYLIIIVLLIVLIIWGPGKLPDVGAGLGRAIREFRKASSETRDTFMNATNDQGANRGDTQPQSPVPPPAVTTPAAPPPPPAPTEQHTQAPPQTPVSG